MTNNMLNTHKTSAMKEAEKELLMKNAQEIREYLNEINYGIIKLDARVFTYNTP